MPVLLSSISAVTHTGSWATSLSLLSRFPVSWVRSIFDGGGRGATNPLSEQLLNCQHLSLRVSSMFYLIFYYSGYVSWPLWPFRSSDGLVCSTSGPLHMLFFHSGTLLLELTVTPRTQAGDCKNPFVWFTPVSPVPGTK